MRKIMQRIQVRAFCFGLLVLLGLCWSCGAPQKHKIRVAVAANMQYAMEELVAAYQQEHGGDIELISGASGKLTQQVQHGAPFDILVSADVAYPKKLEAAGYTLEPVRIYAQGALVLWTTRSDMLPDTAGRLLADNRVAHVALANPETAPYGSAAVAWLARKGLTEAVSTKLVIGESISQASQFMATGHADIGFTAKSVVLSGAMHDKGRWVELSGYPPIEQAAALLKHAREADEARASDFYAFLYSVKAKTILADFGYQVK